MRNRIAASGLATVFILFALVLLFIERAPPIVALFAVILAAVAADFPKVRQTLTSSPVLWLSGMFVAWLLLSIGWSIAGTEALNNGPRIALMILAAVALPVLCLAQPTHVKEQAGRWAAYASSLAVVLLLIETLFDMPLLRTSRYMFNNEIFTDVLPIAAQRLEGVTYHANLYLANRLSHLASIVAILLVPISGYVFQRGSLPVAAATLIAGFVGLALAPTHTPLFAALVALSFALVLVAARGLQSRRSIAVLAMLAAGAIVLAPWLAQTLFALSHGELAGSDVSIIHRFAIWDYAAGVVAEQPLIGSGIEAARVLGREGVDFDQLVPGHPLNFEALPLHPHNAAIQIWLELGGVGALMFALFVVMMTRKASEHSNEAISRALLVAGWLSGITIAHLSYGIWQYWWIASLGLVVAMMSLMFDPARQD